MNTGREQIDHVRLDLDEAYFSFLKCGAQYSYQTSLPTTSERIRNGVQILPCTIIRTTPRDWLDQISRRRQNPIPREKWNPISDFAARSRLRISVTTSSAESRSQSSFRRMMHFQFGLAELHLWLCHGQLIIDLLTLNRCKIVDNAKAWTVWKQPGDTT